MPVKRLTTLQRGLAVLELIGDRQPIAAPEITTTLDLDRSALQRVLVTLQDRGWIHLRAQDRRWELGSTALRTFGVGPDPALIGRAHPVLEALCDETRETVFLAVGSIEEMVVADVIESPQLVRIAPHVGMVIDAELSAAVLAVAAFLDPDRAAPLLLTSDDAPRLANELRTTRARGWSLHTGAVHSGAASIAAPIFDVKGAPIAAIVVCAPAARLPERTHPQIGDLVIRAARTVSPPSNERHPTS